RRHTRFSRDWSSDVCSSDLLELVPAEAERSAAILGAGWLRTTWRITLPLVRPAILAGGLMSFLEAIAEFGTPAFLLIPARTQVRSEERRVGNDGGSRG